LMAACCSHSKWRTRPAHFAHEVRPAVNEHIGIETQHSDFTAPDSSFY